MYDKTKIYTHHRSTKTYVKVENSLSRNVYDLLRIEVEILSAYVKYHT